jgi:excisionase family DNA binding protein
MAKDEWLTVNEAAELSGYHPEHIRRLIRQGEIMAKKFSIVWMVSRNSLLEYTKSQEKISPQDQKPVVK